MKLKIVNIKDPILRQKAKRVKRIDKKIKKLISDMWELLKAQEDPEGVGLAAPQVGKSLQIFLMTFEGVERTIINPKILKISKYKNPENKKDKTDRQGLLEGCLSLPHYYGPIQRSEKIKIKYLDKNGKEITEEFEGFHAHIIQHEIDHLNGIVFIDHILSQKAPLYKFKGDEWEEVNLS